MLFFANFAHSSANLSWYVPWNSKCAQFVEQSRIENEGDPFWIEHQIPEGTRKNQLLFAS